MSTDPIRTLRALIAAAILVVCWSSSACSQNSDAGFAASFLRINASARSSALGGTFTGISDGAASGVLNPSGLSEVTHPNVMLMHNIWMEGVAHDFAGVAFPIGESSAFGFGLVGTFTDLEKRENGTDVSQGKFSSYDAAIVGSYGIRALRWLSFGMSGKFIVQVLENERATGYAGDAGIALSVLRDRMHFGATIQNLGPDIKMVEVAFPLPRSFRAGMAVIPLKDLLLIAADYERLKFNAEAIHIGAELNLKVAKLRVGYRGDINSISAKEADTHITGGLGLNLRVLQLDYAYVPLARNLGQSSMFSLSFIF
jgi:hypothetical protein